MPIINLIYNAPREWKPWANTLAYYPLKEDVLDHSGNWNNGSWNPNSFADGVANYSWNSTTLPTSLVSSWTRTVSVWLNGAWPYDKIVAVLWQHTNVDYWFNIWFNRNAWGTYYNWVLQWPQGSGTVYNYLEALPSQLTWWHYVVAQRDISKIYIYVDGVFKWEDTYSWLSNNTFYLWYDHWYAGWAWTGKVSELIFEDKIWTADEITDYYNQTKSNYWL